MLPKNYVTEDLSKMVHSRPTVNLAEHEMTIF